VLIQSGVGSVLGTGETIKALPVDIPSLFASSGEITRIPFTFEKSLCLNPVKSYGCCLLDEVIF
jgi:hypothetical protein